jgi:hypothetical protein
MRDGLPIVYWAFRLGWSVLHLTILAAALIAFLVWALTDHQGADAVAAWLGWIGRVRAALGNLIPYPWSV